jgi:protease-4
MEFINLEKLYDWAKVKRYAIKTGKFKAVGAEYKEMTPEERELLQTMVDDVLGQFRKAVAEGRNLKMEQVVAVSDGRIFSGSQAKAAHLVDELGTLQDAINAAAKEAKIEGKPHVVYPERKVKSRLLQFLMDDNGSDDEEASAHVQANLLHRLAQAVLGSGALSGATSEPGDGVLPAGIYWLWRGGH